MFLEVMASTWRWKDEKKKNEGFTQGSVIPVKTSLLLSGRPGISRELEPGWFLVGKDN